MKLVCKNNFFKASLIRKLSICLELKRLSFTQGRSMTGLRYVSYLVLRESHTPRCPVVTSHGLKLRPLSLSTVFSLFLFSRRRLVHLASLMIQYVTFNILLFFLFFAKQSASTGLDTAQIHVAEKPKNA